MTAEHYFSAKPQVGRRPSHIEFDAAGRTFRLAATAGVFSAGRLDPGTAVLLRKAPLPSRSTEGALLDLGCGYGPIACVLAACAPRATVYAVDVNTRALELTGANARALGLGERIVATTPERVPDTVQFSQIWSNPPIRVGKARLHDMLSRWLLRLHHEGMAWLVVARNLGGDSLAAWLIQRGWNVERHASQKGYRVLRVYRGRL